MTEYLFVRTIGTLVFLGGVQLAFHRTPRNVWSGLRLPWTLADQEVWERSNRVAGYLMAVYSTLYFLPLAPSTVILAALPAAAVFGSLAALYARHCYRTKHGTLRTQFISFGHYEPIEKP
ncbi:MAG: SdpI family protein [Candidatus Wallbacteria bacterium]|nr:SdpI family protein [Candidatus Wallbacteria bacterium]